MSDYDGSYKSLLINDWHCVHNYRGQRCNALLGRADPTLSIMHQVRSTHHESWTFSVGGVVIAKRCRKCRKINWIASDEVSQAELTQIRAAFDANWD